MNYQLLLAGAALLACQTSFAVTLVASGDTVGSNRSTTNLTSGNPLRQALWAQSVQDAGGSATGVNDTIDASVRYTAIVTGDDDIIGGQNANMSANLQFSTTLDISNASGFTYDLMLASEWHGILQAVREIAGQNASMSISNANATVSGCDGPCNETNELDLDGLNQPDVDNTQFNTFDDVANGFMITGLTGNRQIDIVYNFTMAVNPGLLSLGVRMGQDATFCPSTDSPASCYNNPGARDNDGLYINPTLTITNTPAAPVPLPASLGLLGLGLGLLTITGRVRRRS